LGSRGKPYRKKRQAKTGRDRAGGELSNRLKKQGRQSAEDTLLWKTKTASVVEKTAQCERKIATRDRSHFSRKIGSGRREGIRLEKTEKINHKMEEAPTVRRTLSRLGFQKKDTHSRPSRPLRVDEFDQVRRKGSTRAELGLVVSETLSNLKKAAKEKGSRGRRDENSRGEAL